MHHLGHVVDNSSKASWNTPFCVSVKHKNQVVPATLDTGASLSAVCSLHPLKELKLYAPESLRESLLIYYHNHPTAGHLGFAKTLARMKCRFFWPKMRKDIKSYVLSCPVCQLTKPSQQKPAGMLVPVHANEPWEVARVDFVGQLPRTQAGNAYLLVFVDYFSKWVEVSAVKEATAQVAASKFQSDIFARHGAPNAFFKQVVEALGTEHRLTMAYHPQTNATERVNRTLKTAIRAYVGDKHNAWDKYLPQICFALRTSPHKSTGFSPAKMLYRRELTTHLYLLTKPSTDGLVDHLSQPETPEETVCKIDDHARVSLKHPLLILSCTPFGCDYSLQTFLVAIYKLLAHLSWYFFPLFPCSLFKLLNVCRVLFPNGRFQLTPKIFDGIEVRTYCCPF
uniref:Gypsy retrotransposon integrase-like protein 1 n=1 Tax=Astyanax mexicanus TaxID=7994 RepID=A0A3B1JE64_ASTMX